MSENTRVNVKILDKEYQVACPPEERHALLDAAQDLNERMAAVRHNGSIVGSDRIAVMVALNLCYELRGIKAEKSNAGVDTTTIDRMTQKLEQALSS